MNAVHGMMLMMRCLKSVRGLADAYHSDPSEQLCYVIAVWLIENMAYSSNRATSKLFSHLVGTQAYLDFH